MEFGFTQEQEMIRGQAREFLANECGIELVRELMASEHAHDEELWNRMAAMGWMGLIFPERHGGVGLSLVDMVLVLEEMGRALAPGAFFSTVMLAGLCLLEAGTEEQRSRYLPALAGGDLKATLALTGVDCGTGGVLARRGKGGYVLDGVKLFVPDAGVADLIVCVGELDGETALFAVDRAASGVQAIPLNAMDQTRRLYEVSFEGVAVGEGALLGSGEAEKSLERVLDCAAVGLCAQMVGGAQRTLERTVEYSKSRIQFGRPIGSFQAIQHRCADMLLLIESARSATYAAGWSLAERTEDAPLQASIAKAYSSEAYGWVTGEAIQVHGGMGYTWEHDVHLYFKRAKADAVTFGDPTRHRERVASLIGL